jgi:hypothetical protein
MAVDLYMLVLNKEAINQGMKSVVKTCMEIGTFLIYLFIHQNVFRDFDNFFLFFQHNFFFFVSEKEFPKGLHN